MTQIAYIPATQQLLISIRITSTILKTSFSSFWSNCFQHKDSLKYKMKSLDNLQDYFFWFWSKQFQKFHEILFLNVSFPGDFG